MSYLYFLFFCISSSFLCLAPVRLQANKSFYCSSECAVSFKHPFFHFIQAPYQWSTWLRWSLLKLSASASTWSSTGLTKPSSMFKSSECSSLSWPVSSRWPSSCTTASSLMKSNRHQENNVRDLSVAYLLVGMTYLYVGVLIFAAFPSPPLTKDCIEPVRFKIYLFVFIWILFSLFVFFLWSLLRCTCFFSI